MSERPLAVVTGGARGIGRRIAADLRTAGYRVVIGDLDEKATLEAAAELGSGVTGVRLDITDRQLVRQTIDEIETTLGPIDVWVNNAGIMPTGAFAGQSVELARTIIDVDYAALVETTAAILPRFLARHSGTIVNIGSATGLKPLAGLAVYSGAKAAVIGFSDALRRELRGTGVTVRVVLPNLARTPLAAGITPPKLVPAVTAEQVSRAVLRSIRSGPFAVTVPRVLGPVLRISRLLPSQVQDWLDDRIGTDSIGLGGDPAARAAYQRDALRKIDAEPRTER
ncbi:SDR family NAD(P)-dependent oxidoreductase [Herbiconiux liukaitaii]|uniref:SDR family NAD(P)-dependent oxidoreductase n=1 Tax=Herbiconiux liukaitaii TaxID=3342799 RepID=UPI0035B8F224